MTTASTQQATEEFFVELDADINKSPAVVNDFFAAFAEGAFGVDDLRFYADQYYLYIRTFPQILAGLSSRVSDEGIRRELAKTVVSELGGSQGEVHFKLFEKAIAPLGITVTPIDQATHIPEAVALVEGIKELFFNDSVEAALGGHYTIEQSGLPMISSFYEGFRGFPESDYESMEYFYLHLLVEHEHVEWIRAAVERAIGDGQTLLDIRRGALRMAQLLGDFWAALYAQVPSRQPAAA
ncbi:MAG: iron-containing redox enzyme family protein [Frankia sp.]